MVLPLIIAKCVPWPSVIELTENAFEGISGPACSTPEEATFPLGFQPIGQNGLRLPLSNVKDDLFLVSMAAVLPPCSRKVSASKTQTNITILFIAFG